MGRRKTAEGVLFHCILTIEPVNSKAKITATPVLNGSPRGWPTGCLIQA